MLLLMSIPTTSAVYPASSVAGSLRCELVTVGNSVQFRTAPNEVRFPSVQQVTNEFTEVPLNSALQNHAVMYRDSFLHAGSIWSAGCLH